MESLRYYIANNSYSGIIHDLLLQLSSVKTIDELKLQASSLLRFTGRFTKLTDLHFATAEAIQPIEHLACRTWGSIEYWIDTNGVEHDRFPEYPIDLAD
jgi:hypothetical protein